MLKETPADSGPGAQAGPRLQEAGNDPMYLRGLALSRLDPAKAVTGRPRRLVVLLDKLPAGVMQDLPGKRALTTGLNPTLRTETHGQAHNPWSISQQPQLLFTDPDHFSSIQKTTGLVEPIPVQIADLITAMTTFNKYLVQENLNSHVLFKAYLPVVNKVQI